MEQRGSGEVKSSGMTHTMNREGGPFPEPHSAG